MDAAIEKIIFSFAKLWIILTRCLGKALKLAHPTTALGKLL